MAATKLQRLAELENARWNRRPKPSVLGQQIPPPVGPPSASAPFNRELKWRAYTPLGQQVVPGPTRLANFGFDEATAIGSVMFIRFRWIPDRDQHEYILAIAFPDQDTVDLDGGGATIYEAIIFGVVDKPDWKNDLIQLSPSVSMIRRETPQPVQ